MTQILDSLTEVASSYDAIVLDQWGVLHDGSAPYPDAIAALERLDGTRIAVLSNSGKRSAPNAQRIANMGFAAQTFEEVMTSGEALFRDFGQKTLTLFPIEGAQGDAQRWADGSALSFTNDIASSDAVLLMGLPDGSTQQDYSQLLTQALDRNLELYCSNPDLKSPRGGGTYVMSPGALAQTYAEMGGTVHLYGKPHLPIFRAVERAIDCTPDRLLMVGDSLHHDIEGGANAGWDTLLIQAGVHAPDLPELTSNTVRTLATREGVAAPTYALSLLR